MTPPRTKKTAPSAPERAEQLLTRTGDRLGHLAGRTARRVQQVTRSFRSEAEQLNAPAGTRRSRASTTSRTRSQPAIERAEALVDRLAQQAGHLASDSTLSAQRMVGRLREGMEDMWVEAQQKQRGWQGRSDRRERAR